jgi:hypothetical protein
MSECSLCGVPFTCAATEQTGQACWCNQLPALSMDEQGRLAQQTGGTCVCASCLTSYIAQLPPAQ